MDISFSSISHIVGLTSYLLLSLYIANRFLRRKSDRSLLSASVITCLWLAILVAQSLNFDIPFYIRYSSELMRNAAWIDVLYSLLGIRYLPSRKTNKDHFYISLGVFILIASMFTITVIQGLTGIHYVTSYTLLILQIAVSLVGLLLLEQVWRNASVYSRSGIKFLTIGIGTLFIYDFFMYSDALLFQELSKPLWESRGIINAVAVPFIALTLFNSYKHQVGIHISRQMIFHSTTLIIAGIYLLVISAGGYYISIFGGTWGEALRVLFIFSGLLLLVLLISAPALRAKVMVFISKNFFHYKYDYRDEWIKSTNALADTDETHSLSLQVIKILADLVGSRSGAIWMKSEDGDFTLRAQQGLSTHRFNSIDSSSDLISFFKYNEWIINLDEYMLDPNKYQLIEIPENMLGHKQPWLIIPLGMSEDLVGVVLLCEPITPLELNWENYDLLRIVSQQACSYLEQNESQEKLGTAKQFEAVNKASAFLVHDIKTIIAQLSLLVKNAERHKSNPEFIDDMIRTTSHTVEKMDHLLQQIRHPSQDEASDKVEIGAILLDIYKGHKNSSPIPSLENFDSEVWIKADLEQLKSAIGHIVQNAIEATPKRGEVSITAKKTDNYAFIFIQDSGIGMSEIFIKEQLFKPFESTKGLTGMGIGVYQCREYLRKIGGVISVTSQIGIGTCFTLKVPFVNNTSPSIAENSL